MKWYTCLLDNEQHYHIGDVHYIVETRFSPFPTEDHITLKDRFEKMLNNDFTDLTMFEQPNMIEDENVCSVAGKEE